MTEAIDLLLLPGLDGSGDLFGPLVQQLPPAIVPTAVSYPSAGEQSYARLLATVRQCLPAARPLVVLGWSFSGPLALRLANEAPANLRGVILCASFASNPYPAFCRIAPLVVPALFRGFPFISQAKALLGGYLDTDLRRKLKAAHTEAGPAALAARLRAVLDLSTESLAETCPVPILYLAGSRDRVIPLRCARAVRSAAPSTEIVEVEGPHLALITNPQMAARTVARFCKRVAAGG